MIRKWLGEESISIEISAYIRKDTNNRLFYRLNMTSEDLCVHLNDYVRHKTDINVHFSFSTDQHGSLTCFDEVQCTASFGIDFHPLFRDSR